MLGRTLGAGEMQRMAAAESVYNAYQSREKSGDWVEWANAHPDLNSILEEAMILAGENG